MKEPILEVVVKRNKDIVFLIAYSVRFPKMYSFHTPHQNPTKVGIQTYCTSLYWWPSVFKNTLIPVHTQLTYHWSNSGFKTLLEVTLACDYRSWHWTHNLPIQRQSFYHWTKARVLSPSLDLQWLGSLQRADALISAHRSHTSQKVYSCCVLTLIYLLSLFLQFRLTVCWVRGIFPQTTVKFIVSPWGVFYLFWLLLHSETAAGSIKKAATLLNFLMILHCHLSFRAHNTGAVLYQPL